MAGSKPEFFLVYHCLNSKLIINAISKKAEERILSVFFSIRNDCLRREVYSLRFTNYTMEISIVSSYHAPQRFIVYMIFLCISQKINKI